MSEARFFRDYAGCFGWSLSEHRAGSVWVDHDQVSVARRLIVIDLSGDPVPGDPAGRNESQKLVSMLRETAEHFFTPDAANLALQVADQIEAQTKPPAPPRPEEPTGLGAVVEDDEGVRWVRNNPRGSAEWSPEIAAADGLTLPYREYAKIAVVRVLSEGWSE